MTSRLPMTRLGEDRAVSWCRLSRLGSRWVRQGEGQGELGLSLEVLPGQGVPRLGGRWAVSHAAERPQGTQVEKPLEPWGQEAPGGSA